MILFYSSLILFFPFLIFIISLTYRSIVTRAIRKYIEPKLNENNLQFIEYKWPGFLSTGDFKDDGIALTIMNKNGSVSNSSYAYIYYKKGNEIKKVTVRIDTTFWSIDEIIYSSKL